VTTLRIALLQLAFNGEPQAKGERYCREAKAAGADIALFPEMWNIGYRFPDVGSDHSRWAEQAVSAGGEFVQHFADLARELNMAIGITYLERGDAAPRDVVSLIDRTGETLFTYAKVHTCDFDEEPCHPGRSVRGGNPRHRRRTGRRRGDDLLRPRVPRERPRPDAPRR